MNPLADTLRRLGPAADGLSLVAHPEDRLVPASRITRPGPDLIDSVDAFARAVGTDDRMVAASLFTQAWAVTVTRGALACLAGECRFPDVSAANTAVRLDATGRPAGVVLDAPRFAAVAGDTATSHPSAEVVGDRAALFAWTRRRAFDRHLGPLVEAVTAIAPIGRRLLWGNVAAACAGAFARLAPTAIDSEHLMEDATALLDAPGVPTRGLAHVYRVEHAGRTHLFVRRETCCLYNRLPHVPSCLSCRLLDEEERHRRVTVRLEALERFSAR